MKLFEMWCKKLFRFTAFFVGAIICLSIIGTILYLIVLAIYTTFE